MHTLRRYSTIVDRNQGENKEGDVPSYTPLPVIYPISTPLVQKNNLLKTTPCLLQ
jgi:hypothetical protein